MVCIFRFLYCDETVLNDEHLISILYSARKYNLPILAKAVANRILQILTDDNFFNLIDSTTRFELREVNQVIAKTIQFNTDWLIHRDEFPKIHRSTLTTILEQPRLSVSEAELFDACIIWAKMECEKNEILNPNPDQLRKTLGPLIYLFRISSFTLQELANGPGECEVFNQKEMLDLFFYVANKKIRPDSFVNNFSSLLKRDLIIRICINNPYSPKVFSVPRCLNSHYYNREDTRESSEWPLKCTLSFELDKEVYLVGVKLISSVLNPRFFDFAVTKNLNSKQLLVDQPKVKMEDSNGSIYLKVPIILEAKKNYNISIKVENDQKESYSVFDLKSKQFSSGNDISKKSVSFTGEGKATFFFDDFPKNVYFEKIVIV